MEEIIIIMDYGRNNNNNNNNKGNLVFINCILNSQHEIDCELSEACFVEQEINT